MKANSGLKKNRTKIQMVLTALVILSVVRQFFLGNYHNMFLGILTLILFMVPQFLDRKLNVTIPPGLETVILIFIFSAEILGEINAFYVKIPIWDTILHTTNGFLMAAIGFALIDLFNRSDRFSMLFWQSCLQLFSMQQLFWQSVDIRRKKSLLCQREP